MNKKILFSILATIFVIAPFWAQGAIIKAENNYYLAPNTTIDDNLYAAGSDANVSGTVTGDLFVFGGNIIVSGPIQGDLMSAGGTLNINGKVSGDERVAGGTITISNSIDGDLLAAGGQINIMSGSTVGKDVEIAGGNINYSGDSNGKVSVRGGNVYINGKVKGDLLVVAETIKIGPNAVISGNFNYSSPNEAVLEQGSTISGAVNFNKTTLSEKKDMPNKGLLFGFITMGLLIKLITTIIIVLIFIYFFKKQSEEITKEGISNFWENAGKGFIMLVIVPVVIIISFVSIIGAALGLIMAVLYALFLIISSIMAVLLFAQLCMKYVFKKEEYKLNWWIIILALLLFEIISLIPFIGWLFKFIIFLAAFSGLTKYIINKLK